MQFYFIRHAQSTNNALWTHTGAEDGRVDDPELTEIGQQQAELLGQFIAAGSRSGGLYCPGESDGARPFDFTHLYCSLMVRAVATGSAISRATGIQLTAWDCIHECGGIYLAGESEGDLIGQAGKGRSYFQQYYPHLILPETLDDNGWWNRPFEERALRLPRARQFLKDLLARHGGTDDRVAVISHGGFYNEFLTAVLGLPERLEGRWFSINNTGITRIAFHNNGQVDLVYQNRTSHLPQELIT